MKRGQHSAGAIQIRARLIPWQNSALELLAAPWPDYPARQFPASLRATRS